MNDVGYFYFGVWDKREAGHYLFDVDGTAIYRHKSPIPFSNAKLDGGFAPLDGMQPQGVARLTHADGWTVLSFWDRSGDHRPGSHSTFVLHGTRDFAAAVELARATFPSIWARYTFEVREAP